LCYVCFSFYYCALIQERGKHELEKGGVVLDSGYSGVVGFGSG